MTATSRTRLDPRGVTWGLIAVALVVAITFFGSGELVWFDAALVGYLFGLIFAAFGIVYRYAVWLRRPPTAMLNRRGWDAFRRNRVRNAAALPALLGTQILGQTFIFRRSPVRWLAHQLVFWGCILAALITFPLTLGLLHFESVGQDADRYQVYVARFGTAEFGADTVIGWLTFHGLDISAVLVLAGLFAVSVTGLFLTVSSLWLHGQFYSALSTIHALTVILGLMYIPFGKLFHIFQRPGNLGVAYYRAANEQGEQATCRRCGEGFASVQQVADLREVLPQMGFDYDRPEGGSYQETCPRCRRASVTLAQSLRVGGFG